MNNFGNHVEVLHKGTEKIWNPDVKPQAEVGVSNQPRSKKCITRDPLKDDMTHYAKRIVEHVSRQNQQDQTDLRIKQEETALMEDWRKEEKEIQISGLNRERYVL